MGKIIPMACDHAGFELKEFLKSSLIERGLEIKDFGTYTSDSVDYPDMIHPLAKEINEGVYPFGIIMCGSANGVSMVANKYPNVRCALCWQEEIAQLAKQHNNANIIALPARFISKEKALSIVDAYLNTEFEGGRHQKRVEKIPIK
ncbi:MAG: ribose 5-phosphate isomerase B [Bacteroidales bacterium]|jgi:ribose 5-phosphate isomerase B|nr:ribose 5-phosphate isomerase B [Bacteroidales bacterium]MBQ2398115.1 ribose 5-phosphate isomerase B [Bacteroidales bacterium]MBQ5872643.1 ribose 5-phosphate isomerase B [Bacteroidales bacterium]MBQ5891135.1 ribose 5-phosphate isomerase B [Bacteroidales bacterium]MED9962869.1 ribose 5-phosphate isomerase B [Bacteroidales bacterium]